MAIPESIKQKANKIRNEVYGKDVREALASGIEEAGDIADQANTKSNDAIEQVDNIQAQVNQLVVEGDSSVEAAQARVDAEGKSYPTLKARLDAKETQFSSQLAQKSDVQFETITVKVPSDYSSINNAIDKLSERKPKRDVIIDIVLESGYRIHTPSSLANGDFSHFRISSEDEEVFLSDTYSQDYVFAFYNCRAPMLNCLINAEGKCKDGIRVYHASTMYVTPGSGIKKSGQNNLIARYASTVYANYGIFTEASQERENDGGGGYAGLTSWGSTLYAYGADVSGSRTYGVRAVHGGTVHFEAGIANNCGRHGIRASNAGFLDARRAQANNAGSHGIYALAGSTINAYEAEAKDAANTGVFANQASTIDARKVNVDGSQYGVRADQNSKVNWFEGSGIGCRENVVLATRLSEINARSATGRGAREGIRAEEGSRINFRLGNISSSSNYNIIATEGSEINADVATVKDTIFAGTGHGVYAEKGSKITITGGIVTGSLGNDLRVNQAGIIVAHGCRTSNSTGDEPHVDDINLPAFNRIESHLGIIWASTS